VYTSPLTHRYVAAKLFSDNGFSTFSRVSRRSRKKLMIGRLDQIEQRNTRKVDNRETGPETAERQKDDR
jgi:hypothetical protein